MRGEIPASGHVRAHLGFEGAARAEKAWTRDHLDEFYVAGGGQGQKKWKEHLLEEQPLNFPQRGSRAL
jgi:hypothetical protein